MPMTSQQALCAGISASAIGVAVYCLYGWRHARALRADERRGRIAAEKELRTIRRQREVAAAAATASDGHAQSDDAAPVMDGSYVIRPMAHMRSAFSKRQGCPRQPGLADHVRSWVVLRADVPSDAVQGLLAYSHAWLVWRFHDNTDAGKSVYREGRWSGLRPLVAAPGLAADPAAPKKVGVFACRSPHRGNDLGLSLVRIVGAQRSVKRAAGVKSTVLIEVEGADLLDGTPIFDIKPYLPWFDAPIQPGSAQVQERAAPVATHGLAKQAGALACARVSVAAQAGVASWVAAAHSHKLAMPTLSSEAAGEAATHPLLPDIQAALAARPKQPPIPEHELDVHAHHAIRSIPWVYAADEHQAWLQAVLSVLALDPRSVARGRFTADGRGWTLVFDGVAVQWRVSTAGQIQLCSCAVAE